jgi:hypothetical protein
MELIIVIILIFLLLTFVSGIYFCATHELSGTSSNIETFDPSKDLSGPTTIDCPDMLIKSGDTLLLFNSRLPKIEGVNPFPFYNLDEYINYLENQKKKGIHCPVLFLQEENNTQGKTVFRIRPDVFQPQGGLPIHSESVENNFKKPTKHTSSIQVVDSSREHGNWNKNQHFGFDPTGQDIGIYTELDALGDSTFKGKSLSDNPMDSNWGGVIYTKNAVDSGKYEKRNVEPPTKSVFSEKSDNINNVKKSSQ